MTGGKHDRKTVRRLESNINSLGALSPTRRRNQPVTMSSDSVKKVWEFS
jgi:hypothetical protein